MSANIIVPRSTPRRKHQPHVHLMHGSGRTRSSANRAPMYYQGQGSGYGAAPILAAGFKPSVPLKLSADRWVPANTTRSLRVQTDVDSPELVDRKVKALLNKLTMEKFETISDQIIRWANKSVNEKDGRTLIQVIRLVFEKAIDEVAWSEMYARLCRKMMEQISPEVQDQGIKNAEGKPIKGGHLFRKCLLNRCQEDFERGWFIQEATAASVAAGASDNQATAEGTLDAGFNIDEYYAAQKAKRQGLGLITFIGELFRVRMLTERIMHECVKKLLGNVENPEEGAIESLCQLLKTVGQLLDTPKARAHMDVYFTRMKELGKSHDVSTRMQFMLQDVIELRERMWMSRDAAAMTIAAVHALAAKERAAAGECLHREVNMSRGGSQSGGDSFQDDVLDGWAIADDYVPRAPFKAGDLSPLGNISANGPPVALGTGSCGVFGAGKGSTLEALSRMNSSSNMLHMLSQNPELAVEASTKSSRSSSRRPSIDHGHDGVPKPAVQRKKLQLLPRSVLAAEENSTSPLEEEPESAPTAMSEADVKKEIDRYVREFFALRNLGEAEVYFKNLPNQLCFRLVDNREAYMSRGGLRDGSDKENPDGWAAPGGSVPCAPPKAGDLSQFGKISMGAHMVTSPSSPFAGRKNDSKRKTPSSSQPLNSSSDRFHILNQNPETSIESICPSDKRPGADYLASISEPTVPHRELEVLPRSVADDPLEGKSGNIPTAMSEADVKKLDDVVKEFFTLHNLKEAEVHFSHCPEEGHFRLVDKLVASALKSKETDVTLVGNFFAQAITNGQCTREVFERGFTSMAEYLDDIAADIPKAFDYMAIMLRGAGFQNEPERLHRIASKLEDSNKLVSLMA
ncbi:armadillo-type protein [Suillus occidentalis]|nr:armadillo-type protein [Suillus occidentalis]